MATMGKNKKRLRGVHKKARSPETLLWEREHLPLPQPSWMTARDYAALVRFRNNL
jgi:hypothetical protein